MRGKEIQGVYLEVEVLTETSIYPDYFSANTIVFPGLVFSEPLKKGLFCADMKMPEEEVMGNGSNFFQLWILLVQKFCLRKISEIFQFLLNLRLVFRANLSLYSIFPTFKY